MSETTLVPAPTHPDTPGALQPVGPSMLADLRTVRSPRDVLADAREAAVALKEVMEAKPDKIVMNGETYPEYEDWLTVASFFGVTAQVEWTHELTRTRPDGSFVTGFEARALAVRMSDGTTLSSAEAECLDDEEKWSTRPKYDWLCVCKDGTRQKDPPKELIVWVDNPNKPGKKMPQRERVLVSDEPVPSFQRRSMAQTRACAKALRNLFAWVLVLAGYKPTPAEELPVERVPQDRHAADVAHDETSMGDTVYLVEHVAEGPPVKMKDGTKQQTFTIRVEGGALYYTKDAALANAANEAQQKRAPVTIISERKGNLLWLIELRPPTTDEVPF